MLGVLARWGPQVVATAVANFITGGIPERVCHCHVEVGPFPSPDTSVLDLLRSQLDRCGPESLHCPAVVQCPLVAAPAAPRFTDELIALIAIITFIGGFLIGRVPLAPTIVGVPHRCPVPLVVSAPALDPPAPLKTTSATTSPIGAPGLTPSSLRSLKDGRAIGHSGSA
jgi:hypothetical protein